MSLKALILVITNGLIFFVVLMLSFTFYNQFSKTIDERILLQLNSIKTLKKVQIENYIKNEWEDFMASNTQKKGTDSLSINYPSDIIKSTGIYDLTAYNKTGQTSFVLVSNTKNGTRVKRLDYSKIKEILLERTGMGESGESYLVGEDFYMRSPSRFFPNQIPSEIEVKTQGVLDAFSGRTERGVFKDYRGVEVYSAYGVIHSFNLKLVILSEIDLSEVTAPLKKLRFRLLGLIVLIMLVAIVLSLFLTRIITVPIINMRNSLKVMAAGDYNQNNEFVKVSNEMKDMFDALANLKKSLQGAVSFSNEIGEMNLNSKYLPKSNHDVLGVSLIKMRDKLLEFRNNENKSRLNTKKLLVEGLEKERQRLSRELHDGIGPLLTSLKFYIENRVNNETQRQEMIKIVDTTITEIRLMSNDLMPATMEDFGVGAALGNFVDGLKKSSAIDIKFEDSTKRQNSRLSKTQEINIFRIAQELINNALKHSDAENIRITLSEFDDFVSFFYFDDGKGFNIETVKLGSGIINIKERVEICSGDIQIKSTEGRTTFEIELPIMHE